MDTSPVFVPADVSSHERARWLKNMQLLTRGTDNIYLFAADQKIEHVLQLSPSTIIECASTMHAGALATHQGLLTRIDPYLRPHRIPYIVKLNGKTNLITPSVQDPYSPLLTTVEQAVTLRDEGMPIIGVGYTLYPGSMYEDRMLSQAAQAMYQAHRHGLGGILWIYPRGTSIADDTQGALIARTAGLAPELGADIVKIKVPVGKNMSETCAYLQRAQQNAGNVKVVCSGGVYNVHAEEFITQVHTYLHEGGIHGMAVGRNLFSRTVDERAKLDRALHALIYQDASLTQAKELLKQ